MTVATKHILFTCLMILALSVAVACRNSADQDHHDIVKRLVGKEIQLPSAITYQIGETPIDYDIADADFKIICLLDSTGCTSCKMKLSEWDNLINEFKDIDEVLINFAMIFESPDIKKARRVLNLNNFRHPVAFDYDNIFTTVNSLPLLHDCNTLLLDADNKVICIGNPVNNPKIYQLYKKHITQNSKNQEHNKSNTPLLYYRHSISLGLLTVGDTINIPIELTNRDSTSVNIQDVIPSCDCLSITNPKAEIKPGDTYELNLQISPHSDETIFQQEINIFLEEKDNPETIKLHGFIKNQNSTTI